MKSVSSRIVDRFSTRDPVREPTARRVVLVVTVVLAT